MLNEAGLLVQFAPELVAMQGVTQTGGHIYDVWEHTLHALESLPAHADLALRLAVLLHDTGKPKTKTIDSEGYTHFYGHEDLSAEIVRKVLNRLRFPKSEISRVARIVSMHMRIGEYRSEWKDSAVRRLMRDANADVSDLLALAEADRHGANPNASVEDLRELERRMERLLLHIPVSEFRSPLTGNEIMTLLNVPPGPKVKAAKHFLVEEILEGRLAPSDKETAERLLAETFGAV